MAQWWCGRLPVAARAAISGEPPPARCPRCGGGPHGDDGERYAYLLGLYLGDGCLGYYGRTVALKIVLDVAYPGIIAEAKNAVLEVRGGGTVGDYRPRDEKCTVLTSYTRDWLCLFPQHGPGRKHQRRILLEDWQLAIVEEHPGSLARGLIHSDGWRGENRVRVKGRDYAYPRYQFSSRSDDIRRLFTDACDALGVAWRPWGRWHISVARRGAVALLDEHVGLKT